jgi:hypothetical protein
MTANLLEKPSLEEPIFAIAFFIVNQIYKKEALYEK